MNPINECNYGMKQIDSCVRRRSGFHGDIGCRRGYRSQLVQRPIVGLRLPYKLVASLPLQYNLHSNTENIIISSVIPSFNLLISFDSQ